MNFDVRSYCERLAKAGPKRYRIEWLDDNYGRPQWSFHAFVFRWNRVCDMFTSRAELWAFIGPLADELRVTGDDITAQEKQPDGRYLGHLEATFAAVCEKMEAVCAAKEKA